MDFEFWTSLIKTPDTCQFLFDNCTRVTGEYCAYEGDEEFLDDWLSTYEIVGDAAVPSLGGLTTEELVDGCLEWYGVQV